MWVIQGSAGPRRRFTEESVLTVYDDRGPIDKINELEYFQGDILANIYYDERLARMDLETGRITAWIDQGCSQIRNPPAGELSVTRADRLRDWLGGIG